jgi:hypothetical protein
MELLALRRLVLGIFGLIAVMSAGDVRAQGSQGENYSAGKTPAQLFTSDCTGSDCHSRPQGLAKRRSSSDLTDYLREHYTNSRQSAAALAGYLLGQPAGGGDARPVRTERTERSEKPEKPEKDAAPFSWLPDWLRPDEPAKPTESNVNPTPRSRQTTRRPPKTEDATKPPVDGGTNAPSSSRQTRRQPPKTEDAAKPPADGDTNVPPRTRQSTRQPPKSDETSKPASTSEASKPARRRPPPSQLPKTEDNAGPPSEGEIYRPARRQSVEPQTKNEEAAPPAGDANAGTVVRAQAPKTEPPKVEPPKVELPKSEAAAKPNEAPAANTTLRSRRSTAESRAAEPQKPANTRASSRQQPAAVSTPASTTPPAAPPHQAIFD